MSFAALVNVNLRLSSHSLLVYNWVHTYLVVFLTRSSIRFDDQSSMSSIAIVIVGIVC